MNPIDMLMRRLRILVDRTRLLRVTYNGNRRLVQVASRPDVALDAVEHLEPYGFTSHPLMDAEAIVANPGGNSGRAMVLLVNDRRYRMVLQEGEVALYTQLGDFVRLKRDGSIHLKAASKILLETPAAEFTGTLKVGGAMDVGGEIKAAGDVNASGDVKAGEISLKSHKHSAPGGTTGVPQ